MNAFAILRALPALCLLVSLSPAAASAAPMSFGQSLGFSATSSMWGPGGSPRSFGAKGSIGTSAFGASYDASASSGSVSATVNGKLEAFYDSHVRRGTHDVQVRFKGAGSNVSTALGAGVDVEGYVNIDFGVFGTLDESICLYCKDFNLNTSRSYTPGFGTPVTRTGSFTAAGIGPDLLVVGGGVNVNVSQDVRFTPNAITGLASYRHRGTGLTRTQAISATNSLKDVSLNLDRNGIWDVSFLDLDVANTFRTTFGLDLEGELWYDFAIFGDSLAIDLAGIDLFDSPSFALPFGRKSTSSFSMTVPEPNALALLASGTLGLVAWGRRANSVRAGRA